MGDDDPSLTVFHGPLAQANELRLSKILNDGCDHDLKVFCSDYGITHFDAALQDLFYVQMLISVIGRLKQSRSASKQQERCCWIFHPTSCQERGDFFMTRENP
jgi:hypothetical protein